MATILIVEDENSLRELIAFNLQSEGFKTVEASDANEALMFLEEIEPDLILLDIMLPGLKGTQLLNILKSTPKTASIPIIIISARDEEDMIVKHLELGAKDYLTKPFSIRVLITKIKQQINAKQGKYSRTVEYKGIVLDEENHKTFLEGKELILTHKEFELLKLLLKHPGRVYTRNQLLSNIWGYDSDVYTRTVDAHISSLRKKLGEKSSLIKTVPKIGYKAE
ncbi:response regulator [Deferribacter autotrophicus]|uniref:Response regulator n=1 Tax=Deferribacter autotrophicus TaxID=500465 RepID=A0A5A8F5T4_9BACT|nr:winged helix-turn-helix domain-containing protein [Deferribacter autotrophicus]KAA0258875.1 response regulator [Deferribacter autotrophicus]